MTDDSVRTSLNAMIQHVVTTERLATLIEGSTNMVASMKKLVEADPEIGPEVGAALGHINQFVQALIRAHEFSNARLDVAVDRLGDE